MADNPLYEQIAAAVRQDILRGELKPGAKLPSMRVMATLWRCTPGTVQRAYAELVAQGMIESRPGQGTRVLPSPPGQNSSALRLATLLHRLEGFVLEMLRAGYTLTELEVASRLALDRWRTLAVVPVPSEAGVLRFAGSHDHAVAWIAERFPSVNGGVPLEVRFVGSLGGLMALSRHEVDLAGCHLWDDESDTYNAPFVRHLLPGKRVALLTVSHRRLGLLMPSGNPLSLAAVTDLTRPGLRFVNRQPGAGTRIWLEAQLHRVGLHLRDLSQVGPEVQTHSEVARLISEGVADVGLGIEVAARAFGLGFVPLTTECYELIIPNYVWQRPEIQTLAAWLRSEETRHQIAALGGYETQATGALRWVE
ncbi:MAG: substrate-binding domain-containing protein [Anaerolineae bacterium]|jgi:putative molybdopterin biosynthesis protein|nr:substrate-binding domain-containing protein [Anaerolineae bacterium]